MILLKYFWNFPKTLDKRTSLKKTIHPWIAKGILISIKNKSKLYRKYKRTKDPCSKTILHNEIKKY